MSSDVAAIQAATQQVITDAETVLGTIAQAETEIGTVVSMLAEMSGPTAETVHRAQREVVDLLGSLRRVLADSRADEVAHAHAVVSAAADDLSRVEAALIECSQITEARAQSL